MEREVRYGTTGDGVSIGYWTLGEGPPLVYIPEPVLTASAADDKLPITRRWYERLSRDRRVVRFDHRGMGLSEHNDDYSLAALSRDVAAVVDALQLPSFDLWGDMDGGIIAAAYAARHPERVSRLVLWNAWARAADVPESETLQTLDRLIDLNWSLYARTAASMDSDWNAEELVQYAGYIEANSDPAVARAFVSATWEFDIEDMLPQISCPTLVLHRRDHRYFPLALGRHLAARIPNARLSIVEGRSFYPWFEHPDAVMELVDGFLGAAPIPARPALAGGGPSAITSPTAGGMAVILFTDIADSTALTERLGDQAFRAASRAFDAQLRDAIRMAGGTPVEGKLLGDGVLAVFTSARGAIDAARRCIELSAASELRLHVGLHAGDVIHEDDNVYGGAVNIASRVCAVSAPGEVIVSGTVRDLARTSAGVTFADRGEFELKGIDDAVRLYEVRWSS
jgi:pimeloyl-ACP methyl ester carboxylesterase/class 3 adenylate cyclase